MADRPFPFDPESRRQLGRAHAAGQRKAAERARTALAGLDLLTLKEALDDLYDTVDTPYRELYTRMYHRSLERRGTNIIKLAELLGEIDDMCEVEGAAADAGFVLGFELCRKLLLGEIDLDGLTKKGSANHDGAGDT